MRLINNMTHEDFQKIKDLDALLENDPRNLELIMQKGRIFYSKMADDFAVEAFKQAIQIDPQYVDAYFWLAECLCFHLGEYDEAEQVALQGLKLCPERKDFAYILETVRQDWKKL